MVHDSLNSISRTVFKGAELPEYLVRTITVTVPSGISLGMRAINLKAAVSFVSGAVGCFEEYALCRIFFVYFEFVAFDDDVVC